jgi:hypothetical protein
MVKNSEQRDGPRIDLRLRVRYQAGDAARSVAGEAEASDVSPNGLRLESDKPVDQGTILKLHVDGGEVEELEATGYVAWCRPRPSPTGKTLYDLGVSFESDWLSKDRSPLGSALARIFAMNSYEPARTYGRTAVSLTATSPSVTAGPALELEIGNISVGGMQIRSKGPLGEHVRAGLGVRVEIESVGARRTLPGRVAWVAGSAGAGPHGAGGGGSAVRVNDSFGIEFNASITNEDRALLESIRTAEVDPTQIVVALEA